LVDESLIKNLLVDKVGLWTYTVSFYPAQDDKIFSVCGAFVSGALRFIVHVCMSRTGLG